MDISETKSAKAGRAIARHKTLYEQVSRMIDQDLTVGKISGAVHTLSREIMQRQSDEQLVKLRNPMVEAEHSWSGMTPITFDE